LHNPPAPPASAPGRTCERGAANIPDGREEAVSVVQAGEASDARIATAVSHWAPRFVANGVPLGDFQAVSDSIRSWDEWCGAWSQRGAAHEALGRDALAQGFAFSAGEHYTRAALCYHFAKFLFVHRPDEMRAAHEKAIACRSAALPHLRPSGERVAIPFEGTVLYGNLRRPVGASRPPVVVMCMGLDSAKEEMHAYETDFLARGMATLAFDGPGQGEAEYTLAIRCDYEVPVKAVCDWLGARPDVDADRIGLWGVSLGGYYAPRAAAFESRVRACVSLSGPYRWVDAFDAANELTREAFRARCRARTMAEAREKAASLTLEGVAARIRCPLLVIAGERDTLIPASHAERIAAEAKHAELLIVAGGNHVANNVWYRYRPQSADWMAGHLNGRHA
jgi:2,6-dihydroxypseudooxynicotine hydrolase